MQEVKGSIITISENGKIGDCDPEHCSVPIDVITSYSIHYTKLYDGQYGQFALDRHAREDDVDKADENARDGTGGKK